MKSRESNAHGSGADRFVATRRAPYSSPVLVEYGDVSKLTRGSVSGSYKDKESKMVIPGPTGM